MALPANQTELLDLPTDQTELLNLIERISQCPYPIMEREFKRYTANAQTALRLEVAAWLDFNPPFDMIFR